MSERVSYMMGTEARAAGRVPPHNPLFRLLYEAERFTLGPTVGIIENIQERFDPRIKADPIWQAMYEGWKEAKTFDNIIKNPWLAFALNVGADPLTWIPGSWLIKPTSKLAKVFVKGFFKTGVQNYKYAAKSLHFAEQAKDFLGRRFVKDYDLKMFSKKVEKLDDESMTLMDIVNLYGSELEDFTADLAYGPQAAILSGIEKEDDLLKITYLMESTARPDEFLKAMKGGNVPAVSPKDLSVYMSLSDGGKDAFKYTWLQHLKQQMLLEDRGLMAREVATGYELDVGHYHFNHIYANQAKQEAHQRLMRALYESAEAGHATPEAMTQIMYNVPEHMKPLASIAATTDKIGDFKKAIYALKEGDPTKELYRLLEQDEALTSFQRNVKRYRTRMGSDSEAWAANKRRAFLESWPQIMAERIWNNPRLAIAKSLRKLFPDRQIRAGEYIHITPTGKTAAKATAKHPVFPTAQDIVDIAASERKTPYRSVKHFYDNFREAVIKRQVDLRKMIDEDKVPAELFAGYTQDFNVRALAETAVDPEYKKVLHEIANALDAEAMNNLPYNPTMYQSRRETIFQIAAEVGNNIETRADRIVMFAGASLAEALAKQNFVNRLLEYTIKNGYAVSKDALKDPEQVGKLITKMKNQWGDEAMRYLVPSVPGKAQVMRPDKGFVKISHPAFKGLRFPKAIANEINRALVPASEKKARNGFYRVWKQGMDFWRAWTLPIFIQYHTRNMISNFWNNYLAGMGSNPIHFFRDMEFYREAMRLQHKLGLYRKLGKELTKEEAELLKDIRKFRVVSGGEFVGHLEDVVKMNSFRVTDLVDPRPSRNFWIQKGYLTGRAVEDNARLAHYLWARNAKGMSAKEAAESVHKFLFDYKRGLTPFEHKWMRNVLMPFYAWTRFNLPLQVEMLARQPGVFVRLGKFKEFIENQMGGPDPEEEFMADWMKRAMSIRWRYNKDKGTYEYFMLDTWLPAADINKVLSATEMRDAFTDMLAPGIKVPIEIFWNYDLFKKRPLSQYEGEKVPIQIAPGQKVWMTPQIAHVLRLSRLMNDIDRYLSSTEEVSGLGRALRFFLGKSFPFNPQDQKLWIIKKLEQHMDSLEHQRNRAQEAGDYKHAANIQEAINLVDERIEDYRRR